MQTRDQAQEGNAAMAQAVRLPGDDPPSLLLVAPAQQQIELRVPIFIRVFGCLGTMRTLTFLDYGILHNPLSTP